MRKIRLLIVAVCLLQAAVLCAQPAVNIYRDKYGVPSIAADRLEDAVYGLGYAVAQDNAEHMARNFKQARGRRAEVDGPSALLADTFIRSLGIEDRAEKSAATLRGETAQIVRSFCAGANRALTEQKARLPDWIEPFTPVDVLALAQLAQAAFPLQEISNQLLPGAGSNQFAISPKRSATGHAILSEDPHLAWSGPLLWYEYSLYSRSFNFHGITLAGLPMGSMGHTDHVAWCMTNNNPRLYDFLTLTINPANPKQYSYHGEWRDFEEVAVDMKVREDGQLKTRRQTLRRTAWGPLVPFRSQAVRMAIPDILVMLEQSLRMARALTGKEFRKALMARGLSMWNIVYADTQGHIGYQYNANLPRRDPKLDWTTPLPGSDTATKWGDMWSLDELPHAEDPASGLLVNCNTAPWLTTLGPEIQSAGWPAYVTSYGVTTRYERLVQLLTSDSKVSPESAKRYATDTLVPYSAAMVKGIAIALQHSQAIAANGARADVVDQAARNAVKVLTDWNGRADIGVTGCGLYLYWMRADRTMPDLARRSARGAAWTPDEERAALQALKKAADEIRAQHGRLDPPWGEVHVTKRGDQTVPVSGLGYFAPRDSTATVTPNFGAFRDGRIVCEGGSSFRMIVHLDPKDVRSWSILPYGNSQDPANPHYADQQALFGRGEYKDTNYGIKRFRSVAVSHITISAGPTQ